MFTIRTAAVPLSVAMEPLCIQVSLLFIANFLLASHVAFEYIYNYGYYSQITIYILPLIGSLQKPIRLQ